jgi:hypothetical protein
VAPANTVTSTNASEFAVNAVGAFLGSLNIQSAASRLMAALGATRLIFDGKASISLPHPGVFAPLAFVTEAGPLPVGCGAK